MGKRNVQVQVDEEVLQWFDTECKGLTKTGFVEACFIMARRLVEEGLVPHPGALVSAATMQAFQTETERRDDETKSTHTPRGDGPRQVGPDSQIPRGPR